MQVQLVAATEAPGVRPVVVQHDGQAAPPCDPDEGLRPCLFDSGLHPEACRCQCLHTLVMVFQQVGESLVGFGERPCLLTCGRTDFARRLDTQPSQCCGELVVGHDVLGGDIHLLHQRRLAGTHFLKMFLQERHVEVDHWFGVHAQRLVDHHQLTGRETHLHLVPQGVGQVHVVLAVLTVLRKVCRSEVPPAFAQCGHNLVALLAQSVVRCQLGE